MTGGSIEKHSSGGLLLMIAILFAGAAGSLFVVDVVCPICNGAGFSLMEFVPADGGERITRAFPCHGCHQGRVKLGTRLVYSLKNGR